MGRTSRNTQADEHKEKSTETEGQSLETPDNQEVAPGESGNVSRHVGLSIGRGLTDGAQLRAAATVTRHTRNDTTGASCVPPEAALRAVHAPPARQAAWQLERLVGRPQTCLRTLSARLVLA